MPRPKAEAFFTRTRDWAGARSTRSSGIVSHALSAAASSSPLEDPSRSYTAREAEPALRIQVRHPSAIVRPMSDDAQTPPPSDEKDRIVSLERKVRTREQQRRSQQGGHELTNVLGQFELGKWIALALITVV